MLTNGAPFSLPSAPTRSLFSTVLVAYLFVSGGTSSIFTAPSNRRYSNSASSFTSDGLKNRVFFTFVFVEMISWFWIWVTLREERDALVEKSRKTRSRRQSS